MSHTVHIMENEREHYYVVDADPEGEKAVGAVPLRARGLRGEDVLELSHLVDDGSRVHAGKPKRERAAAAERAASR